MTNVAVVLSGCGYLDGAEIREAVFTLLALDEAGAKFQCFAPNKPQMHVVNHLTGEVAEGERNVLEESARIARGNCKDLAEYNVEEFDALIFPGGFGGAKNLSTFAVDGPNGSVDENVRRAVEGTKAAGKPIGFICITPASIGGMVLGRSGVKLTIGDDAPTAAAVTSMGATHVACPTTAAIVDEYHRVASTPAYMDDGARPKDVYKGISECVGEVLRMAATVTV